MSIVSIRTMQPDDLAQVIAIQDQCYLSLAPESLACYQAKLAASANTCFVAEIEQNIAAYMIALPWNSAEPPAFNALSCPLPARPDCLYLHDLAVSPEARKAKVGQALVERFFILANTLQLNKMCLIAVDGAHTYWQRFDFVAQTNNSVITAKLAGYGEQAQFMQKIVT